MLTFYETDPEFTERFRHFAFDEVPNEPGQQLPETDRWLVILAALMGCQGVDAFRELLLKALDSGLSPSAGWTTGAF